MHKIIYLDTNIFLHYQPFDQIDWLEVVKADSATIVFPPVTIRELNKHKDSHPRAQIKKRGGETIKRLSGLLDSGSNAKISEKVLVFFEDRDPDIEFTAHQLNFNVQDDHLIASIIMNRQESPTDHIVLVTSDLGLTLVAKAGRQGINTLRLPKNLRIADEPDPYENKVKQLEQQIRELNSRVPKLSLTYEDGRQHAAFNLPKPVVLEQSEIDEKLTELKRKFPNREKEDPQGESQLPNNSLESASIIAARTLMGMIPQEEIDRYNDEAEKYIPLYANYMIRDAKFENLKRRTIRLNIVLANDGTTPAEDVDIYMHFPNGFQLLEEHELPDSPILPEPPVQPMTQMQKFSNSMKNVSQMIPAPYLGLYNHLNPSGPPPNVSGPNIKRSNSYEIHFHVQKVKHNLQALLDPLFVVFDSFDSSSSFTIEYKILAANIPHEVTGSLHVIVEKKDH